MNLGDPELELIDPTPNVHALFIHFDKLFFQSKLASRAVVRWSKRMYSCAGVCSYEGRGGLCDIALSEPLLKLRPRKNLLETLLHEMIHAYLFVTKQDQDRDGHGPNFKYHMNRINDYASLNISIYHDFHDEVKIYQNHWWRCNGICQRFKPYFGIVRRSRNQAPGPTDLWWSRHQKTCGGKFIKIKEPPGYRSSSKSTPKTTTLSDITKYIKVNSVGIKSNKPILKDNNIVSGEVNVHVGVKSRVITKKEVQNNPTVKHIVTPSNLEQRDKGQTININIKSNLADMHTVRMVWTNKQFPPVSQSSQEKAKEPYTKHTMNKPHPDAPKNKIPKIDNYFKPATATTSTKVPVERPKVQNLNGVKTNLNVMKSKTNENKKDNATKTLHGKNNDVVQAGFLNQMSSVNCPICSAKVDSELINRHLDECLNRDVIKKITKENMPSTSTPVITNPINPIDRPVPNIWETVPKFNINNTNIKIEPSDDINDQLLDNSINRLLENQILLPGEQIAPLNNVTREIVEFNKQIKNLHCVKDENIVTNNAKITQLPIIKAEPNKCLIKTEEPDIVDTKEHIKADNQRLCLCCGKTIDMPIDQHLDECSSFINTNPKRGENLNDAIIILDDDEFDETSTLNSTLTKYPCPCCLKMIEQAVMNDHLDVCLN